jgi:hypothetical protein
LQLPGDRRHFGLLFVTWKAYIWRAEISEPNWNATEQSLSQLHAKTPLPSWLEAHGGRLRL